MLENLRNLWERSRCVTIEGSTVVNRPIEDMFDCLTTATFIQQVITTSWFQKNAMAPELQQISKGAMGVGTKFRQNAGVSGRPLEAIVEVVEYQRPTLFAFEVTRGLNVTRSKWVLQPTSDGTRVTLRFGTRRKTWLGRVLSLVAFFVSPQVVSSEDAQRMKQYLEEQCKR